MSKYLLVQYSSRRHTKFYLRVPDDFSPHETYGTPAFNEAFQKALKALPHEEWDIDDEHDVLPGALDKDDAEAKESKYAIFDLNKGVFDPYPAPEG